jgi:hypothetical protein
MIAGVQELHSSTFDATAMQTDPFEGRNQLRSEKFSAYRKSTLDQGYLSENPTNQHQTAQESLQDPSATCRHGGDIDINEFEVDDNFRDKPQWAEQRAVSSNCHCKTLTQSGNRTLDQYYMLRSP